MHLARASGREMTCPRLPRNREAPVYTHDERCFEVPESVVALESWTVFNGSLLPPTHVATPRYLSKVELDPTIAKGGTHNGSARDGSKRIAWAFV